jgi:3-methyladenine DNA glycosylase/8-oxoguanine DNA glycosylase
MFLMFNLGRPDVLPVDDLGVRNAARRLYRMRKIPDAKRLRALAERWRPYRSAASWYLWRSGDVVLPDGTSPKPLSSARRSSPRKKNRTQKTRS